MVFKLFKKGASGGMVKDAQKALAKRLKVTIKGDGKFGPATEEHIKAFQKKFKLKIDGLLGPKTMEALMPGAAPGSESGGSKGGGKGAALKGQTKLLKKLKADVANVRKVKAQHDKELAKVEADIAKAGDDAELGQMMMLKLQQAMQKQQQLFQMLTQIMKKQEDTMKSIIKNIR